MSRTKTTTRSKVSLPAGIPRGSREVAYIDFTGLEDGARERIIYKTPGGRLKAVHQTPDGARIVENVCRQQVADWLRECTIPKEFRNDMIVRLDSEKPSKRIWLRMPYPMKQRVGARAKELGISKSKLAETAIRREMLDQIILRASPDQLLVVEAFIDACLHVYRSDEGRGGAK